MPGGNAGDGREKAEKSMSLEEQRGSVAVLDYR